MTTDLTVQDGFAQQRSRDWKASSVLGAACSILISVALWYGEHGSLPDALGICVLAVGVVGIIVGSVVGIILRGIPDFLNDASIVVVMTCVNYGLYTLATFAIIRGYRAVARRRSAKRVTACSRDDC